MSNVRIKVDPAETNGIKINTTATAMSINALGPVADAPSGTKTITGNGTVDVSGKASAAVNVQPVVAILTATTVDETTTYALGSTGADFDDILEAAQAGKPVILVATDLLMPVALVYTTDTIEGAEGTYDIFTAETEEYEVSSDTYTTAYSIVRIVEGTGSPTITVTAAEVETPTEGD